MAHLGSYANADRDIEQALIALKKGAQLLKYGRKGKPKFYPFRLSALKDMAEKLPLGAYVLEILKLVYLPNGLEPNGILYPSANGETNSRTDQISSSYLASHPRIDSATSNGRQMPTEVLSGDAISNESNSQAEGIGLSTAVS